MLEKQGRSDVLLWTPTYGRAKAGRPARTYIQQLCEDTGCSPEDLPEAMNDREKWRERVRDIRAGGTTWWWWWLLLLLFTYQNKQKRHALSVTVIVVGNGIGDSGSNLRWGCLSVFHLTLMMFSPANRKYWDRLGSLAFVRQPVQVKENSEF